jgi:hypothetical protein
MKVMKVYTSLGDEEHEREKDFSVSHILQSGMLKNYELLLFAMNWHWLLLYCKWKSAKVVQLCLVQELLSHGFSVNGPYALAHGALSKYYIGNLKQEAVTIYLPIPKKFCMMRIILPL